LTNTLNCLDYFPKARSVGGTLAVTQLAESRVVQYAVVDGVRRRRRPRVPDAGRARFPFDTGAIRATRKIWRRRWRAGKSVRTHLTAMNGEDRSAVGP
jgi:hypothetical protein